MTLDLRAHFSIFRGAVPDRIHLAAHSHHYWPDVAVKAHGQAAVDAARLADGKWDPIFGELMPRVQQGIAQVLSLPDPATIAFAPNTHELVCRLLSGLALDRPARVLTSDGEFHSFHRQIGRLEEDGLVTVERIATAPYGSFAERLTAAASHDPDLVFVSQVFFDSGATAGDLGALVAAAPAHAVVAIDGYHAFMALPTDLSNIAARAFYLAGGYKYAMSGEGACFMHCPPGIIPRPRDTGWFAAMDTLSDARSGRVGYAADGSRFLGATFDPSGLYRMAAVLDWMAELGLTTAAIHAHVMHLQSLFMEAVTRGGIAPFAQATLVTPIGAQQARGHFLTYDMPDAAAVQARLAAANIVTDVRGTRLRLGFGCYHAADEIPGMVEAIRRALK